MEDNIFTRTVETVRGNPSEYEAVVQDIVAKIRNKKDTLKPGEINKGFIDAWNGSSNPMEHIVIAWLLTDYTIGTGEPKVDKALADILLEPLSDEYDGDKPERLQGWISGVIFADEENKKWLYKALMAMTVSYDSVQEKLHGTERLPSSGGTAGNEKVDLFRIPTSELIKQGENNALEFKETLEYDTQQNRKNSDVLFSSLKAIAGFLNAVGGTLLIGVDDSGDIKGIERDLSIMRNSNTDRFEQKIRNHLKDRFEPQPIGKVNVSPEKFTEGTVCRVDIQASKDIIHLDGKVYVRDGNTTQLLKDRQLTDWIQQRKLLSGK